MHLHPHEDPGGAGELADLLDYIRVEPFLGYEVVEIQTAVFYLQQYLVLADNSSISKFQPAATS